jgi:hypothetical protein
MSNLMKNSAHVCEVKRQSVPYIDESLDVGLVIFHGLQDESDMVVGSKIICVLSEHIHNVYSLWLSQKLGRFGIL